jgi:hypothetical protein
LKSMVVLLIAGAVMDLICVTSMEDGPEKCTTFQELLLYRALLSLFARYP